MFIGPISTLICSELKNDLLKIVQRDLQTQTNFSNQTSALLEHLDDRSHAHISPAELPLLSLEFRLILALPNILSIFITLLYLYYNFFIMTKCLKILSEAVPNYINMETIMNDLNSLVSPCGYDLFSVFWLDSGNSMVFIQTGLENSEHLGSQHQRAHAIPVLHSGQILGSH